MSKHDKTKERVLEGRSNANIRFDDLCSLLVSLEFRHRINGGHHIFTKPGIIEIINLQAKSDGKAKPYQVRQVGKIITQYKL